MDIQVSKANSIQKVNFKNNEARHQISLIKFKSVEYLHFKSKIEEAEKRISDLNEVGSCVADKLLERTCDRDFASTRHKKNVSRENWYRSLISWRKRELQILHWAIEELNSPNKQKEKRNIGVCSPHEEINILINDLRYRIKHGSNNLKAERKLLRKIKEAKAERERMNAEVFSKPNIWGSRCILDGSKEVLKNGIKLISTDLDKLMEKLEFDADLKCNKEGLELEGAERDVVRLENNLESINKKKDEMYEYILQLKRQSDEVVRHFTLLLN